MGAEKSYLPVGWDYRGWDKHDKRTIKQIRQAQSVNSKKPFL
jgi:hypothetical protein